MDTISGQIKEMLHASLIVCELTLSMLLKMMADYAKLMDLNGECGIVCDAATATQIE